MTGTERKRNWRLNHPEQSREAERLRALARRNGFWGTLVLGATPRPCVSQDSYQRYEGSTRRFVQRMYWPKLGPGSAKMSLEERGAASQAWLAQHLALLLGQA